MKHFNHKRINKNLTKKSKKINKKFKQIKYLPAKSFGILLLMGMTLFIGAYTLRSADQAQKTLNLTAQGAPNALAPSKDEAVTADPVEEQIAVAQSQSQNPQPSSPASGLKPKAPPKTTTFTYPDAIFVSPNQILVEDTSYLDNRPDGMYRVCQLKVTFYVNASTNMATNVIVDDQSTSPDSPNIQRDATLQFTSEGGQKAYINTINFATLAPAETLSLRYVVKNEQGTVLKDYNAKPEWCDGTSNQIN